MPRLLPTLLSVAVALCGWAGAVGPGLCCCGPAGGGCPCGCPAPAAPAAPAAPGSDRRPCPPGGAPAAVRPPDGRDGRDDGERKPAARGDDTGRAAFAGLCGPLGRPSGHIAQAGGADPPGFGRHWKRHRKTGARLAMLSALRI